MAITRVKERYGSRKGGESSLGVFAYTRIYDVIADTALSEPAALDAVDPTDGTTIPKYNQNHSDDTNAGVVARDAQPKDGDEKQWEVTIQYKTRAGVGTTDAEDENDPADPTTQRPVVRFGHAPYSKVAEKAYDSADTQGNPTKPVLNSATDPFDPPIMYEYNHTIIEVSYNVRRFDPDWMRDYENTINSEQVRICNANIPAKKARINSIDCEPLYDSEDELYWNVTAQIELSSEGFTSKLLDSGFNKLVETEKTEITVKDKDGKEVPASEPQRLDGAGAVSSESVYLSFDFYYAKSWKALNLPRSF